MSQIKVDNVKHVVPHTQVDVVQNKRQSRTKSEGGRLTSLNMKWSYSIIPRAFDGVVDDIDVFAKVEQIKAQLCGRVSVWYGWTEESHYETGSWET